ncbi:hypothetical protein [Streptomyces californicus]|uniref:hypothetical protein n=1 Tax=Streptomyces californicus TaxID=67351 RepID=UPI00296F1A53|nr:hypothetical protein [Streptomyces californicus]MDW4912446.1 hypothetical protein [Streptomyces californicus]
MNTNTAPETPVTTPDFGVEKCDPSVPAPAVVVTNTADMKSPGHGYTLPLVGRERPHSFEAVLPEQSLRVFADRPADILAQLIPGYAELEASLAQAIAAGDQQAIDQAEVAAFDARTAHATKTRRALQQKVNASAQEVDTWDALTEEERELLAAAAAGQVPTGVLFLAPAEDDLGNLTQQELGEWSATVPLVINRGEYVDGDVEEPASGLETKMPDGRMVVVVVEHPENLVLLDPLDPFSYLSSLERAGVITLVEREYVPMDELFTTVMELGADAEA